MAVHSKEDRFGWGGVGLGEGAAASMAATTLHLYLFGPGKESAATHF